MNGIIKMLGAIFLTSVASFSCSNNEGKPAAASESAETTAEAGGQETVSLTTAQYKVAAIQLSQVEMRNLSSVLKVNGLIDVPPHNMVSVSAPLGGYLKSAGLLAGQPVRKGQVIAVIENAAFVDLQQEYLEAASRIDFLTQELKRQQELRKEDINAAKTLQQVSSEYNIMRARIGGLEQKLLLIGINANALSPGNISRVSNLYSPINGYVKASYVNRGKFVQPTDVIFELANKSDMHLALEVFEKDVAQIVPGQQVRFSLTNESGYNRTAKIFLVGKSKGVDGTIPVHCHLDFSNDAALLPGMYVKALIPTSKEHKPTLPVEAIVQSEGKDYVFIHTDSAEGRKNFRMVPVIKGIEQEGYAAVEFPQSSDSTNAKVVIKGAYSLLSVMKNVEE